MANQQNDKINQALQYALRRREALEGQEVGSRAAMKVLLPLLEMLPAVRGMKREDCSAELHRCLCVRMVAALEGCCRDQLASSIDALSKVKALPRRVIEAMRARSFSIADVARVFDEKVGIGELATATSDLKRPTNIITFASSVTGQSVGDLIRAWEAPEGSPLMVTGQSVMDRFKDIDECVDIRNHCAHHAAPNIAPSLEDVIRYFTAITDFLFCFGRVMPLAWAVLVEADHPEIAKALRENQQARDEVVIGVNPPRE